MRTHHYPSDVTDAQWNLIEPHLPPGPGGGRPRKTKMRDVLDAILYILRTGCQWRYLPGDLPPKSTVWREWHSVKRKPKITKGLRLESPYVFGDRFYIKNR